MKSEFWKKRTDSIWSTDSATSKGSYERDKGNKHSRQDSNAYGSRRFSLASTGSSNIGYIQSGDTRSMGNERAGIFGTKGYVELGHGRQEYDRRHSYNDIFDKPNYQSFKQEVNATNREEIDRYFEYDPHQRVKVTLSYFEEIFASDKLIQLPKFPIENSLRNYQLVLIGFKAGRIDIFYVVGDSNSFKVGDLVIVEADRGRDLGKVVKLNISIDEARLLKHLQFQEQHQAVNDPDSIGNDHPVLHFPKQVVGLVQTHDMFQILNKQQDEEKACRLCLSRINTTNFLKSLGSEVDMKLIDAEYQFDRKKLIFYYSTNKRIDFRELVRELFRIYKTRIWMCAVVGLPYETTPTNHGTVTQPAVAANPVTAKPPSQGYWYSSLPFRQSSIGSQGSPIELQPPQFQQDAIDTSWGYQPRMDQPTPIVTEPVVFINPFQVPRTYDEGDNSDNQSQNDEMFVLKSLVDQINH